MFKCKRSVPNFKKSDGTKHLEDIRKGTWRLVGAHGHHLPTQNLGYLNFLKSTCPRLGWFPRTTDFLNLVGALCCCG